LRTSEPSPGDSQELEVKCNHYESDTKEAFGIYASSLPSSFYRKNESLPPDMRYYDGKPPEVMKFGTAWQNANFELIDKTTEVAPGITLIALVSDATGGGNSRNYLSQSTRRMAWYCSLDVRIRGLKRLSRRRPPSIPKSG
jgi:hypothetical protein